MRDLVPRKTGHITASSNRCLGARAMSQYKDRLSQIWDPMSWDHLILNIVISILVRRYLYIDTGPWILHTNRWVKPKFHLTIYYTQVIHFRVLLYDTKCLRFIEIHVNFDYKELVFRHIACFICHCITSRPQSVKHHSAWDANMLANHQLRTYHLRSIIFHGI